MVWANVNPNVPHPRWSQSKEQLLEQMNFKKHKFIMVMKKCSYFIQIFQQEKLKLFR